MLQCEWVPLAPGDTALVQQLWRLYRLNGERNGQTGAAHMDGLARWQQALWPLWCTSQRLGLLCTRTSSCHTTHTSPFARPLLPLSCLQARLLPDPPGGPGPVGGARARHQPRR